jgi:membrane fusion protein, macrolide-specific efflux system
MSTQVFFVAAQARDALVIPASALNFKVSKPEEADGDKKWGGDKKDKDDALKQKEDGEKESDKEKSSNSSADKSATTESATSSVAIEVADVNAKPSERGARGERDSNAARGQASANGEEPWARKRGQRRAPPSATDDVKPQPAVVQVMDEKGNLTERKIMVGISSRVRVQVLEGLEEGEKVVSGMRQPGKPGAPGQDAMSSTAVHVNHL